MPRINKGCRVTRRHVRQLRALVKEVARTPGMFVVAPLLPGVINYLNGAESPRGLLGDEFREWLAHEHRLDCEYVWPALAMHILAGVTPIRREIHWSPDLTLTVTDVLPMEEAIARVVKNEGSEKAGVQALCRLLVRFLDWRETLTPQELRRWQRKRLSN